MNITPNKQMISLRINADLYSRVVKEAEDKHLTKTDVMEDALFNRYKIKNPKKRKEVV